MKPYWIWLTGFKLSYHLSFITPQNFSTKNMSLIPSQIPRTNLLRSHLGRRLSWAPSWNKKKQRCEETDCCGKPINVQPKPTVYVERACHPCCFYTWKPKMPILETPPPLVNQKKRASKKMVCYAGMKFREKSMAQIKEEAAECQKQCGAHPVCPPRPPPPPPKKPECDLSPPIPEPDWDFNLTIPVPKKTIDKCKDKSKNLKHTSC